MGLLRIDLQNFKVIKKQDIDKDEPYLWIIGFLIDSNTLVSGDFVIRKRPTYGNIGEHFKKGEDVKLRDDLGLIRKETNSNLLGIVKAGVAVVAWEHDKTSENNQKAAYDAVVKEINKFIKEQIKDFDLSKNIKTKSIEEDVKKAVKKIFVKDLFERFFKNVLFGAAWKSPVALAIAALKTILGTDDFIGVNFNYFDIDPSKKFNEPVSMKFEKKSTEYKLQGVAKYEP
jgi:hypothetical protein